MRRVRVLFGDVDASIRLKNGITHHPLTRKHPGHVDHPSLVW